MLNSIPLSCECLPGVKTPGPIEAATNSTTRRSPALLPGVKTPGPIEARWPARGAVDRRDLPGVKTPGPIEAAQTRETVVALLGAFRA